MRDALQSLPLSFITGRSADTPLPPAQRTGRTTQRARVAHVPAHLVVGVAAVVVRQHVPGAAHVEVLRAGSDPLVPDELPAQSHFQLRYHLALRLARFVEVENALRAVLLAPFLIPLYHSRLRLCCTASCSAR